MSVRSGHKALHPTSLLKAQGFNGGPCSPHTFTLTYRSTRNNFCRGQMWPPLRPPRENGNVGRLRTSFVRPERILESTPWISVHGPLNRQIRLILIAHAARCKSQISAPSTVPRAGPPQCHCQNLPESLHRTARSGSHTACL